MTRRVLSSDELNYRVKLGEARLALDMALGDAERPIVSSKFGSESAVFLHLVTQCTPDIPVVRIETGYDTRATLSFIDELTERLSLNLMVFRPIEHTLRQPPELDAPEHAAFVEEVKLEPFRRALAELEADVWLTSIRRYQSDHRADAATFGELGSNSVLKVSPMLGWKPETMERYAREHDLPRGPEAFDPTKGEPFRECGLHTALGA